MKINHSNPLKVSQAADAETQICDITPKDVLKLDSFRELSGEQAAEIAATLKAFTQVVFFACMGRKTA